MLFCKSSHPDKWDNRWENFQEDAFLLLQVCRCFFALVGQFEEPRSQLNTADMSLNYDLVYLGKDNIMLNCLLVIYHFCEFSSSLKVLFRFCQIKKVNILI